MGLFDFLKKRPAPYEHEVLGVMTFRKPDSWVATSATLPALSADAIEVELRGDVSCPSPEATEGLRLILKNPEQILAPMAPMLFELWQNYFSEQEPPERLEGPSEIWRTAQWIALAIRDTETFSATVTFLWQGEDDDHLVTAYVENGRAAGTSIDG